MMRGPILDLTGVAHIALTPFNSDETVDTRGIAAIVNAAHNAGAVAVVPLAIMGEAHKLVEVERDQVLQAYVDAAGDRLHVIAGITSESTYQAVDRARRAADIGASALMMAPPRNCAVGPLLVDHYRAVTESTGLAMVVQDEPVTTGVTMPGPFFAELERIEQVFAVKVEQAPSPPKVSAIKRAAPRLRLFGGLGGVSLYEELRRGSIGIMTGFAYPELLARICTAYLAGDPAKARTLFYEYLPIIRFEAQLGVGGVAIRKQLFFERGIIANPAPRRPSPPLDPETVVELRELVEVLGLEATT